MPEVSQYYRQQRLAPLSGVGNLSASDIAAATQGNRELARAGGMVTEFGMQFMEQKEKAEFHDQLNTAKTDYLTKFFNYEQGLQDNADTETYMPGLEAGQTSSYKFTNKRAANEFELWKANEDLSQTRRVFGIKNEKDVQNYTKNWSLGIREATRRTASAMSDSNYQLELANGMSFYGLEYATDEKGEPILDEKGNPTIRLIEDWENPLLDTDEVRMAGYESWKADADAKREVNIQDRIKESVTGKFQEIIDNGGSLKDAYAPINEAVKAGLISPTEKGTLTANASGYQSRMDKKATTVKHQKELDSYTELSDLMLTSDANYDDLANSNVDPKNMENFQKFIKGSWTPNAEISTANGLKASRDAVFSAQFGEIGTLGAKDKLMDEFFVKKSITKEQYEWGIDRIENPYPRAMASSIESVTVDQGKNWWGTSKEENRVEINNTEFLEWVDTEIAKGSKPNVEEMRKHMASIVSGKPVQDTYEQEGKETTKTIIVVNQAGDRFTVDASELQLAISKGYRVE